MRIDIVSMISGCTSLAYHAEVVQKGLLWIILAGILVCVVVERSPANEFVGVLALALEDDVAREMGLSESTLTNLRDLIDQRENEAIELAYEVRELPKAEQTQRLASFREQSEKLGLALLTEQQRDDLEAFRLARKGMGSLAEEKVANTLGLTAEQRTEVKRQLDEFQQATLELDRRAAERERKRYDYQLKALLTKEQLDAWQKLSSPSTPQVATTEESVTNTNPQVIASPPGLAEASGKTKMRFSFRYAPWGEVIQWFATQAKLSLVMDAPPQGTLNYSDQREYTPSEAIDLLNSVLLTKGYTLVRRDRMLMVINLEDGIPPNLITEVSLEQLDDYGEYELVRCLFTLQSAVATDVEEEIARLIGPQGAVAVLDSSNQLLITETAGRLRTFRTIIEAAERKNETALGKSSLISLTHVRAAEVIGSWQKLMGLSEEENSTLDGSLRVATGKSSRELIVSGRDYRVQEFKDLVQLLDMPAAGGNGIDAPQLEVYPITDADPASVLEVTQTLMADEDDVRLASDPQTGSLVVLAPPAQHRTIKATIDQMQRDRREVEVIRLGIVDPQLAMMSIEKLFGPPEGEEAVDTNALRVDADLSSRSLLIRGSQSQIAEIRGLLTKMGEAENGTGDRSLISGRGNLRMIPIDAATARRALGQMNSIWPAVRKNTIRIITPSSSIRGLSPSSAPQPDDRESTDVDLFDDQTRSGANELHQFTTTRVVSGTDEGSRERITEYPDVIVTPGDQGLLIASEDVEALDDFEQVFRTVADRLFTGSQELAVFYLKYAKAEVAAELLKQVIGGSGSSSSGGSGALLGKLAGAALGGGDGGLIGSLLGMGDSGGTTTTISGGTRIIADARLNALVVHATPKELDHIERMLEVLDTSASPEAIETIPKPRTIPIINTSAEEIASIVRSVYASRLAGGGGTPREPSPEEVIRALSGQKNNDRTIKDAVSEQLLMNVSVDQRRNALIVVAPDWLFQEVKELVAQLDVATPDRGETVRVVQTSVNPEAVRNALAPIIGEATTAPTSQDTRSGNDAKQPTKQPIETPSPEQIKRRLEFLKAIQSAGENKKAAKVQPARK